MEGTIQPYKEDDVVLLSEPIKCKLFYGKPNVEENLVKNQTAVFIGVDRKYTVIEMKESEVARTSISPNEPVPQAFWYRVVSMLKEERYRYRAVAVSSQLVVKIPHSVLSSPPQLPINLNEFLELGAAAIITGPREFSCQMQHEKVTVKAGDIVLISSPPMTSTGSSHTAISKKSAHYLVKKAKIERAYDLFYKATSYIDHSKIAGFAPTE